MSVPRCSLWGSVLVGLVCMRPTRCRPGSYSEHPVGLGFGSLGVPHLKTEVTLMECYGPQSHFARDRVLEVTFPPMKDCTPLKS